MVTLSSFLGDHHDVFGKHVLSLSVLFWPAVQKRTLGLNLRIIPKMPFLPSPSIIVENINTEIT